MDRRPGNNGPPEAIRSAGPVSDWIALFQACSNNERYDGRELLAASRPGREDAPVLVYAVLTLVP